MSESYFIQIITEMIFNFPKQKLYIYIWKFHNENYYFVFYLKNSQRWPVFWEHTHGILIFIMLNILIWNVIKDSFISCIQGNCCEFSSRFVLKFSFLGVVTFKYVRVALTLPSPVFMVISLVTALRGFVAMFFFSPWLSKKHMKRTPWVAFEVLLIRGSFYICDWHHVASIHSESPGFLLQITAATFTFVESDTSHDSGFLDLLVSLKFTADQSRDPSRCRCLGPL